MAETANLRQRTKKPLGQRLVEAGLITTAQLDLALREQKRLGLYLGDVLESLGFAAPEVIAGVLAEDAHTKVVDVVNAVIDPDTLKLIPYETARKHKLIPLSREGNTLTIAMADTFDVLAIDTIGQLTGLAVDVQAAPEQAVMEALARHYAAGGSIDETIDQIVRRGMDITTADLSEEAPMIRLVDQIIALAVKRRATDIHVEPDEKIMRLRMRVDGVLRQELLLPKALQAPITARLKIMAGMNVTEKRLPQDGRISFLIGVRQIDLRVSAMPTSFGENIVIRILDKSKLVFDFPSLGLDGENLARFEALIDRPHGIILVTGPTGAGKTTTLYTALSRIDAAEHSIFTLEDPVEYRMGLIRQTQVQADIGMTFAAGLRAILRQDPDVVLLGEIRDTETAELAVRASLTGHLVLSTLHTNDAIGAIPRLVDMGIEPYLLVSALTGSLAQRLVRRICPACKEEAANAETILERLPERLAVSGPIRLWRGKGCDECQQTGYKGRLGIYELFTLDERYHDPIVRGMDMNAVAALANKSGMRSMLQDGVQKALAGLTTVEEVLRVIR